MRRRAAETELRQLLGLPDVEVLRRARGWVVYDPVCGESWPHQTLQALLDDWREWCGWARTLPPERRDCLAGILRRAFPPPRSEADRAQEDAELEGAARFYAMLEAVERKS